MKLKKKGDREEFWEKWASLSTDERIEFIKGLKALSVLNKFAEKDYVIRLMNSYFEDLYEFLSRERLDSNRYRREEKDGGLSLSKL